MGAGPRRRPTVTLALVGRRQDFRESSRLVTLLSRELGIVTVLAKGAHRPDSPCLGRLDFLNEVEATLGGDAGGLRLLLRIALRRERRSLREPQRFLAASHLAWLGERVLPEGEAQPMVFDLLLGGLALLERCPVPAIPAVVLGLELRLLQQLGALPDLDHCATCGAPLPDQRHLDLARGLLVCAAHAEPNQRRLPRGSGELLRTLRLGRGVDLPSQAGAAALSSLWPLPPQWLFQATEQRSRLRHLITPPPGK